MNADVPSHQPMARPRKGHAVNADPNRWDAIGLALLFGLTLPSIFAALVLLQPAPPAPAWSIEASTLGVDRFEIARGEIVYQNSCAVCHGPSGDGVLRLGKPVRNSAYVQSQSDTELIRLIVEGRAVSHPLNTSGALMPPRGAVGLSDGKISDVVIYLRAIQDLGAPTVSVAAWETAGQATAGSGEQAIGVIELTGHPGYEIFVSACAACHGQGGEGVEGLGLPLITSGYVRGNSDNNLITFIKMGRPPWDENNTTGLDMPPKGGNPSITDDELRLIVGYMRAIQKEALGS